MCCHILHVTHLNPRKNTVKKKTYKVENPFHVLNRTAYIVLAISADLPALDGRRGQYHNDFLHFLELITGIQSKLSIWEPRQLRPVFVQIRFYVKTAGGHLAGVRT